MAQKLMVIMSSDLTGKEGDDVATVSFALDGTAYEIDLTAKESQGLRNELFKYVEKAREVKAPAASVRGRRNRPASARRERTTDLKLVREWAIQMGFDIKNRGRVPADVVAKYDAAHP